MRIKQVKTWERYVIRTQYINEQMQVIRIK